MKAIAVLSLSGLLLSTAFAAASRSKDKDVNIFLHEETSGKSAYSLSNALQPGLYTITSLALNNDQVIGRGPEDFSLLPKKIKIVNRNDPTGQIRWLVERLGNGRYLLRAGKEPVAAIDSLLFAIILPEPPASEWIINYQDRHDAYTIESEGRGWIADREENAQVAVRHLIVGPSNPPFFPPTELFKFTRIDYEVEESSKKIEIGVKVTVEEL